MNHIVIDGQSGDVTVHLAADQIVTLRWPTCADWDQIVAAYRTANETIAIPPAVPAKATLAKSRAKPKPLALPARPFATAFATVIDLLSNSAAMDPALLPIWCDDATLLAPLRAHWTTARIGEADQPIIPDLPFVGIPDPNEGADGG